MKAPRKVCTKCQRSIPKARYASGDKAEYAAKVKAYRAANPDKSREWHRNDKARRKSAPGSHTAADVRARPSYSTANTT